MFDRKVSLIIGLTTKHGEAMSKDAVVTGAVVPTLQRFGIDAFSVTDNVGYWRGTPEHSITVQVYAKRDDAIAKATILHNISTILAEKLDQEAVLYSVENAFAALAYTNDNAAVAA